MKERLNRHGQARLIAVMAITAVILVFMVIAPKVRNLSDEKVRQAADDKYEEAAKRSALLEFNPGAQLTVRVYDGYSKQFVETKNAGLLTPYGNTHEHEGKVILLTMSPEREVVIAWLSPEAIAEGDYAEETNR